MESKFTNRLIKETSPYLLQHAHNPVDWYPWGKEALQKAKDLDLPILASIGYSACHWCHVMEHESFENEEVADYMNKNFINIKIDREERPDLDHIYMEAVQAITGSGGWPLNIFLTPDAKPFYGGTYFPPQKAHNRSSWIDILNFIHSSWNNKKEEILEQADTLVDHIRSSGNQLLKKNAVAAESLDNIFTYNDCSTIAENILLKADKEEGGFGVAPKFPQTFTIQYLLQYGYFFKHQPSTEHALLSLKKMLNGGIYDHLAGGLARYSTDRTWLAPHFEKMLYDNALLVNVLCDAYQVTHDNFFKKGIEKTLSFLLREMKHKEGGFYAAFDADSEGVEGKFYVWDKNEILEIIKDDALLCCEWYGVIDAGNWEGKNILHIHKDPEVFAKEKNITVAHLELLVEKWNFQLLEVRKKRIHPSLDDKLILGWNALLLTAFCKSYAATGISTYYREAIELYNFISVSFKNEDGYFHTFKNGIASQPAFLDDLAYYIQACLLLQEITSDQQYLQKATELTEYVTEHFLDIETGMYFFTNINQDDVIIRKTEIYDGAVPSGNSIMIENLLQLSILINKNDWGGIASNALFNLKEVIIKYPTSFAIWAATLLKTSIGVHEIVITGHNIKDTRDEILSLYIPNKVLQSSDKLIDYPLLNNKKFEDTSWIYLCKKYSCFDPVQEVGALKKQLINEYLNIKVHNI
ncbi:MAG: thioredoxin domain-containing protein [Ferruginibacter sp.]